MTKKITKDELKLWLDDPCTEFFCNWMMKNHDELVDSASKRVYHSLELDKKTIQILATAKGIHSITSAMEQMIDQAEEEREAQSLPENQRPKIEDNIKEMIQFVYGGEDDNS